MYAVRLVGFQRRHIIQKKRPFGNGTKEVDFLIYIKIKKENNMETYFAIKLWTEYYIPIILIVAFLVFSAIAICLAVFANFCKKKFHEKNQNDDRSEGI